MMFLLHDPLLLLSLTVSVGMLLGKIRIGSFSLGSSATLFVGLFLGWTVIRNADPAEMQRLLSKGVISIDIFYLALALFIGAVGLSSAKYLDKIVRVYGSRLLILGALVPAVGALGSWGFSRIIPGVHPATVPGVFTGSLTSSPGLAAAIEQVAARGPEAEAAVGFGYAVSYIPGVLTVVLGMQLLPLIFRLNAAKENQAFCEDLDIDPSVPEPGIGSFRPLEFFLIVALGSLIGSLKLPLGRLGSIGLGATGGILGTGLVLGYFGKVGRLNFRMPLVALSAVRELGICLFLAVVGLRYGYRAVESLATGGIPLLILSLIVAVLSMGVGFLFGRYVLKLNWILLAGALCGAMTSTPGLGAAVESTGCDDVASGYGAVYPVALLSMVLFTILLSIV